MTSKIQPVKILKEAKYSFAPLRNAWYCGKKPVDEEEVLIHLTRFAKSQNIQNAGEYAASALEKAKAAPEPRTPLPTPERQLNPSFCGSKNNRIHYSNSDFTFIYPSNRVFVTGSVLKTEITT